MTVTLTAGARQYRGGSYQAKEDLTQSTATAKQALSVNADISTLAGGTATGFNVDNYTLAAGVEGQLKTIVMLATGEAKVELTGTATGKYTFLLADSLLDLRYINAKWRVVVNSATIATST